MAKIIPYGDVLEDTRVLPDWNSADIPDETFTEAKAIRALYCAAISQHLKDAVANATPYGETTEEERAESRRILLSRAEPWASTRKFLCLCAEIDELHIRRVALAKLTPIMEAERAAEPMPPKPTPAPSVKVPAARPLWSSADLLRFLADNESRLDPGEIEAGLAECERRAERERLQSRPEYGRNTRAGRYIATDTPAIAAE